MEMCHCQCPDVAPKACWLSTIQLSPTKNAKKATLGSTVESQPPSLPVYEPSYFLNVTQYMYFMWIILEEAFSFQIFQS